MMEEYMLVRKSDKAVVVDRLFVDEGISTLPIMAKRGEHKSFADMIKSHLDNERSGVTSFGKFK